MTSSCNFTAAKATAAGNKCIGQMVLLMISRASWYCVAMLLRALTWDDGLCHTEATYLVELSLAQRALGVFVQRHHLEDALGAYLFVTTLAKSNHLQPETV